MSNEMREEVRNKAKEISKIKPLWYRKEQMERYVKHYEKTEEVFHKHVFQMICGKRMW